MRTGTQTLSAACADVATKLQPIHVYTVPVAADMAYSLLESLVRGNESAERILLQGTGLCLCMVYVACEGGCGTTYPAVSRFLRVDGSVSS